MFSLIISNSFSSAKFPFSCAVNFLKMILRLSIGNLEISAGLQLALEILFITNQWMSIGYLSKLIFFRYECCIDPDGFINY